MDELLRQLIREINQQEIGSLEHTTALEHLLALVPHLPGIRQDSHPDYSKALDKTLKDIRRNLNNWIEKVDIDLDNISAGVLRQRFVNWVNMFLKWDIIDLYRIRKPPLSLDNIITGEKGGTTFVDTLPDPQTFDDWLEQEERNKQRLVLKRYLEQDPDGRLRNCYPANCPECNCQAIAYERYLNEPGVSVLALAKRFGIPAITIFSRWKRNCLPILLEIVDNYNQYLYLLDKQPVYLSKWFENVFDSAWQTIELILGEKSVHLVPNFRSESALKLSVRRAKLIDLGMQIAGNPLALIIALTKEASEEIGIQLRLFPTGEQQFLPPNLQLIVFEESGETCVEARARNSDNWIQLVFTGLLGESFSVKIALVNASVREDFVI